METEDLPLEELELRLTPRQKRFVEEYEKDGNGARAAIRAGYCVKDGKANERAAAVTASRLLRNANVVAYRHARAREIYKNLNLTPETLALKLVEVYNRCMEGTPRMVWDYERHCWVPDGTWSFDSRGAVRALELLGKSIGMFEEKVAVRDAGGVVILPAAEIAAEGGGAGRARGKTRSRPLAASD